MLRTKIPAKTWSECKDTPASKALTHSYSDLRRLLKALSMEPESDQVAKRQAHINYAQYNAEAELFTGEGKGEGKGSGKGREKGRGRGGGKGKVGRGWQWTQEHPPPGCWPRRRLPKWLRIWLGVTRLSLLLCLLLCIPAFLLPLVTLILLPAVRSCVICFSTVFAVDGNFESSAETSTESRTRCST